MEKRGQESLWQSSSRTHNFPSLQKSIRREVVVIGAGITGITTAYLLTKAGKKVVVLDHQGLASGETAYTTAHLTGILDERFCELIKTHGLKNMKLVWKSHMTAINTIEKIIRSQKIECDFRRVAGHLSFESQKDSAELEKEEKAMQEIGIPVIRHKKCLIIADQAEFHPLKYLAALHKILVAHGVEFYSSRVREISEKKSVFIQTSTGKSIFAKDVIAATHSPITKTLEPHVKMAAYISYVIAARAPKGAYEPHLFWDTEDPYHYVRSCNLPSHDLLIIGGEDHKSGQEQNTEKHFKNLQKWATEKFPFINKVEWKWSGQVMETIDGLALIGRNPGNKHTYIATGYSGNGMTNGTIAALLITDLILGVSSKWEEVYRPTRKKIGGIPTLLKEGANLAKQYLDLIPGKRTTSEKNIAVGCGGIIQEGLQKVAVYKETPQKCHHLSAICPHLGCVVAWNASAKTWDCPCHGSRFSAMGKVIHGPAKKNLSKISKGK
jgi:glycine/D-amino acid oxidase-like deaminating enzyme/nitrite reductase/ring-hydroxylating ferredoxin subunit